MDGWLGGAPDVAGTVAGLESGVAGQWGLYCRWEGPRQAPARVVDRLLVARARGGM